MPFLNPRKDRTVIALGSVRLWMQHPNEHTSSTWIVLKFDSCNFISVQNFKSTSKVLLIPKCGASLVNHPSLNLTYVRTTPQRETVMIRDFESFLRILLSICLLSLFFITNRLFWGIICSSRSNFHSDIGSSFQRARSHHAWENWLKLCMSNCIC